jgi:hypothetical protein
MREKRREEGSGSILVLLVLLVRIDKMIVIDR